jgi:hypothetical protein
MNVFISYRRDDTQDLAGRLADRLRTIREIREVFLDVEAIAPGADFARRIRDALARDPVCLLLLGNNWRGARQTAGDRILDADDFVRMEAAAALASGLRVLPVLANDATMPAAETLPDDLRRLPALNALSLRHAYFDHDAELLIAALLERKKPGTFAAWLLNHPIQAFLLRGATGLACGALLLVAGAVVHMIVFGRSLGTSLGGPGPVSLLIVGVLLAGALAGALMPPRTRRFRSSRTGPPGQRRNGLTS